MNVVGGVVYNIIIYYGMQAFSEDIDLLNNYSGQSNFTVHVSIINSV